MGGAVAAMAVMHFRRIELARGGRALAHDSIVGGRFGRRGDVVAIALAGAPRRRLGALQPPQAKGEHDRSTR